MRVLLNGPGNGFTGFTMLIISGIYQVFIAYSLLLNSHGVNRGRAAIPGHFESIFPALVHLCYGLSNSLLNRVLVIEVIVNRLSPILAQSQKTGMLTGAVIMNILDREAFLLKNFAVRPEGRILRTALQVGGIKAYFG